MRHGDLSEQELALARWFIVSKTTYSAPEISAELAVALWQVPALREPLVGTFANGPQLPLRYQRLQRAAAGRSLDGLLERWLPVHIERDVDNAVFSVGTRAELTQLVRIALTTLPPDQWLALYQAFGGYSEAACFLDELRRLAPPAKALAKLAELARQQEPQYPDDQARHGWLRAALAAWGGS